MHGVVYIEALQLTGNDIIAECPLEVAPGDLKNMQRNDELYQFSFVTCDNRAPFCLFRSFSVDRKQNHNKNSARGRSMRLEQAHSVREHATSVTL